MRKLLAFLFACTILFSSKVSAQGICLIDVYPMYTNIVCPGDSVLISAVGGLVDSSQIFDFNTSALPAGWSASGTTFFSSPCIASLDNTPYYWAATSTGIPGLTTAAFDVTCGGLINFEMVYAVQGGTTPCEGPDQSNEGVSLQYSLDGGLTWIDIIYYSPGGFTLPTNPMTVSPGYSGATAYTSWNSFQVAIPAGALSTSTMFRWTQSTTSGSCCDNWGIDNIAINATGAPCGTNSVINWSTGLMDTTSFWMVPTGDTSFVAYVYDTTGVLQCTSDTVYVNLFNGAFSYNLPASATVYCPLATTTASVTGITATASQPISYNWSSGSTTATGSLAAGGNPHDTITYYVDVTDGCGFTVTDSLLLYVNQSLTIDAITHVDQSNCSANGSAHVVVSGNQGPVSYNWSAAPGATGNTSSISSNMNGLSPGWYYVTVTDNVCSTNDSVYIDHFDVDLFDFNLFDTMTVYCPGDSALAQITGIVGAVGPISYNWSNGSSTIFSFLNSTPTAITDTITFYVTATEACGYIENDSIVLVVSQIDNLMYNLPDTITKYCPFETASVGVSGVTGASAPITYLWSNGSTLNTTTMTSTGAEHEELTYYVTFQDKCLRTRTDSVIFVIDKKLNIDLLTQTASTTCQPDGSVNAVFSGATGSPILLWQDSIDHVTPGMGGSISSNLWNNITGGWYYFTITDNVCFDVDSIQVDMLNPPLADFTVSSNDGCAGMYVDITNTSQNCTYYEWDFGNGNTSINTDLTGSTQQYFTSGQITLLAYLDNTKTCGTSATLNIDVVVCGCTDPNAMNYDPTAVINNGSCVYPIPVVQDPNVFTPNGDGKNDLFFFETIYTVEFKLTIVNRWGNVMYDRTLDYTVDYPQGWDGKTPNGNEAGDGTYFYNYEAIGINGDTVKGKGFVQLVRN